MFIPGRRDILGAAETGSGKTLAFGLPILSGILKLKEKAELKGLDVYDIPYKKGSSKKKDVEVKNDEKRNKKDEKHKNIIKKKKIVEKPKEPSEDGYSSGDESNKENDCELESQEKEFSDDDYLEEIELPVRKRDTSADEGNDSDDENYIHLSDMLDSDDLVETSDDDNDDESKEEDSDIGSEIDEEIEGESDEEVASENEESDIENEEDDEENQNEQG